MNNNTKITDIKFSACWAVMGIALGLLAFIFNYTMAPISLPGYEIIAGPAMFALSFFSKELHFWPKMVIFIIGQYVLYFLMIFMVRKLIKYFQ